MRRRVFNLVIAACIIGLFGVAGLWIQDLTRPEYGGGSTMLAIGRNYHVVEFESAYGKLRITVTRFTKPLTAQHPDAHFFRTQGYGWFVDNARDSGIQFGYFLFGRSDCDYEWTHTLFMTEWIAQMPYWFVIVLASVLPTICFLRRGHRRDAEKIFNH
jgi:hypothetical protein